MKLSKFSAIAALLGAIFFVNNLFAATAISVSSFQTCADPAKLYKKATTITGDFYDTNTHLEIGTSTMKIAKISKKGTVKVTLTLTPFFGSKISGSGTFKPDACGIISGQINLKNGMAFYFTAGLEYEGDTALSFESNNADDSLEAWSCLVGGEISKGEYALMVEMQNKPNLPAGYSTIDPYSYPFWDVGKFDGSKCDFGKVPKMKYVKVDDCNGGYNYELSFSGEGTNVNALNLKYNKKKGSITGSFKFYYSNAVSLAKGKKPTLKNIKTNIKGARMWGDVWAAAQFKFKKKATNFNVEFYNGLK